jgi:hypothetical protein
VPITSAGIGKPEPTEDIKQLVGGHIAAAKDLIAAIEQDRPTLCNEKDGRIVTEMIMGVFASHRAEGRRVEIPLSEREHPFLSW